MTEKTYNGVYLILSLKWSDTHDHLVWWCANNAGYTADIDKAGHYDAVEVAGNPSYYDNEGTTRAVPLYNVMEGLVGPIRRIVDTKFRYPRQHYDCHACGEEVSRRGDSRDAVLKCASCGEGVCAVCYDTERCPEEAAEVTSGGSATEETGA